jgi:hypothetical protein
MIIGLMADHVGVRWALALASAVVLVAALISSMVVRRRRVETLLPTEVMQPANADDHD